MQTSNPLLALLQGIVLGLSTPMLIWAADLPLDWKIGSILFGVGLWTGIFCCWDWSQWWKDRRTRSTEIVMRDVAWNFATSAPADLEGFKLAVAHYQQEVSNTLWEGERVVCPSGLLTIVVHRPWLDGEKGLTWLELESPDKTAWTEAQLMFSLHQAMTKLGELYDHSYFEGLIRHDERSFELILGS